jgi:hypothetical protein
VPPTLEAYPGVGGPSRRAGSRPGAVSQEVRALEEVGGNGGLWARR